MQTEDTTPPEFVIDDDPRVDWPVNVRLPTDGGEFALFRFSATFRVLSETALDALLGRAKDDATEPDIETGAPLAEVLARNADKFAQVVVGWAGVKRSDGTTVAFTEAALRAQITGPRGVALSAGLWLALNEVRYGARLGNSAPPPAAG